MKQIHKLYITSIILIALIVAYAYFKDGGKDANLVGDANISSLSSVPSPATFDKENAIKNNTVEGDVRLRIEGVCDVVVEGNRILPSFEDLLDAICWVESRCEEYMMGDAEPIVIEKKIGATAKVNYRAIGAYQIHESYVDDVNRILGLQGSDKQFTYEDRWDKAKSREMTAIYIKNWKAIAEWDKKRPPTQMEHFEAMARIHNGGPDGYKKESTKPYWLKIKARLDSR